MPRLNPETGVFSHKDFLRSVLKSAYNPILHKVKHTERVSVKDVEKFCDKVVADGHTPEYAADFLIRQAMADGNEALLSLAVLDWHIGATHLASTSYQPCDMLEAIEQLHSEHDWVAATRSKLLARRLMDMLDVVHDPTPENLGTDVVDLMEGSLYDDYDFPGVITKRLIDIPLLAWLERYHVLTSHEWGHGPTNMVYSVEAAIEIAKTEPRVAANLRGYSDAEWDTILFTMGLQDSDCYDECDTQPGGCYHNMHLYINCQMRDPGFVRAAVRFLEAADESSSRLNYKIVERMINALGEDENHEWTRRILALSDPRGVLAYLRGAMWARDSIPQVEDIDAGVAAMKASNVESILRETQFAPEAVYSWRGRVLSDSYLRLVVDCVPGAYASTLREVPGTSDLRDYVVGRLASVGIVQPGDAQKVMSLNEVCA